MRLDPLARGALLTAPRILGFVDRDPNSPTSGCCERYYWKYKLHDYPNARFQEAALFLAQLHALPFPGNIYYGKPKLARWIIAICRYWLASLKPDGTCQEMYPNERSFCATAFSAWSVSQALRLLGTTPAAPLAEEFLASTDFASRLRNTGLFIQRHTHFAVNNQAAAAAVALQSVALVCSEDRFAAAARDIVNRLLSACGNGRFTEYGGFDLGYATITLSCLGWYAELAGREVELAAPLARVCDDLSSLFDTWGHFDSSGMSRGTRYVYPHVFARCAHPVMAAILRGLEENRIITPLWMDDRYCIALAADHLKALSLLIGQQP